MRTYALLPLAILIGQTGALAAGDYPAETLEEHRAAFEDTTPVNFDDGGRISHYVFKNITAFYRAALIARTGEARPLETALRRDVSDHPVENNQRIDVGAPGYVGIQ